MPFSYLTIKRQSALRLAQIIGADQATLQAAYAGAWVAALDGAEIPAAAFKDLVLMIEKELVQVIGNNPSHPARSLLYGRSADLANLATIPTLDSTGVEFCGVFDSVADSATNAPLTLQPTQTLADEADTFFDDTELFNYNMTGNQIRHTRPLAYLQGVVWSYSTQSTAYDADGNSPLPQACANLLVNGVCGSSLQVGWTDNAQAASTYQNMYQSGMQMLLTGLPSVPLASTNAVAG
jgi:hypothetical protein